MKTEIYNKNPVSGQISIRYPAIQKSRIYGQLGISGPSLIIVLMG